MSTYVAVRDWASAQRAAGRYEWWIGRTKIPLLCVSLAFLGILLTPLIWPELSEGSRRVLSLVGVCISIIFTVDYVIRLYLAQRRWHFIRRNVVDLIVIILPMLRPLRPLRALRVARLLRLCEIVAIACQIEKMARSFLHKKLAVYIALVFDANTYHLRDRDSCCRATAS